MHEAVVAEITKRLHLARIKIKSERVVHKCIR